MTPPTSILRQAASTIRSVAAAVSASADASKSRLRGSIVKSNPRKQGRSNQGRRLNPDVIERAITAAGNGVMRDLTDISRETIDTDPHLGSVLQKRFCAVSSLPYEIRPAKGDGIDTTTSLYFADVVRSQISRIPKLQDKINRLAWGLFDGRAASEIKWKVSNDPGIAMQLYDLTWIHPRRLNFGPSRELRLVDDGVAVSGNFPAVGLSLSPFDLYQEGMHRKFVSWTSQLFNDYPEREGLARRCLYWSFFKRYSTREWMILLELFGKPWRIITVEEDSEVSEESLESAEDAADGLGSAYTARMPQGTKLDVVQPGKTAGEVNHDVIQEADKQISKLVLGQTGTTDGAPAGFNSNQTDVMKDEQTLILTYDASTLSDVITDGIVNAIIEVNFGREALSHAPKFVLRADRPADRQTELTRLKSALDNGLEISVADAYEVSGFAQPDRGVPVLRVDQPPTPPLSPTPPPPRPVIVYPAGTAPDAAEQEPPASAPQAEVPDGSVSIADNASITTVNEAREAKGLPPLTLPDGTPDPNGELTVAEYNEKISGAAELSKHFAPDSVEVILSALIAKKTHAPASCGCVICSESGDEELVQQPKTDLGSPEDLIQNGRRQICRAADNWAKLIGDAIDGAESPDEIVSAVNEVFEELDLQQYARVLERRMLQSAALGAMDNAHELGLLGDDSADEKVEASARVELSAFSVTPFKAALQSFLRRKVLSRTTWDKMSAEVKRKSFTIAGVESEVMRSHVFGLLSDEVRKGADIRSFKSTMFDSLKAAGLISSVQKSGLLGMSHIDTVFRTNVLNAYNAGRIQHASQPSVKKAFPVWEIISISDSRSRDTHRRANGTMLRADDPFWKKAYPPFGFNCRCRVRCRSAKFLSKVVSGATIFYLPDSGFTSGYSGLI